MDRKTTTQIYKYKKLTFPLENQQNLENENE